MAAKDTKEKADGLPTLSQAELKLIALGVKFSIGGAGKVDYDQIAKYGGYTKGSAQVLYRKVLRKLTDSLDVSEASSKANAAADGGNASMLLDSSETTTSTPATPAAKTPKTPRSRKSGGGGTKRTKQGAGAAADESSSTLHTPSAPGGSEAFLSGIGAFDGSDTEPTPSKRQRKSPTKKASSAKSAPETPKTADSLLADMPFVKDEEDEDTTIKSEE